MPDCTAAYALARPAPRVLWKCAPSGRSPINGRTFSIRVLTRRGVVVPMVSAIAIRLAPKPTAAEAMSSTRCGSVGPSKGQSHAVAMITSTEVSLARAMATMSAICAVASAEVRPTFAWEWVSEADTTYSMERRPAAMARLAPLGLATSAENSTSGNLCSSSASSAASARAGTFEGDTNAVASTSRTPVATMASRMATLADNGIGVSICRPSRRHTSRISTLSGRFISQHPLGVQGFQFLRAAAEQAAVHLVVVLAGPG
ncbi:hypothetical protein BN975_01402 [Mycolicibacterium farcinogenes]|nr:hypothetical protein BN975_01402 [Mycolicibacterium farcinogenes]